MSEREWQQLAGRCLRAIRERRPLVHHITNEVTAQLSADAVLSLGATAAMARDAAEVESVADQAASLVLNLGTLTRTRLGAMARAHRFAIRIGRPMVLDPVGAGAIAGRADAARRLLRGPSWMAVRLNAAELSGIMEVPVAAGRGVDAEQVSGEALEAVAALAQRCAERHEVVVAVTGPVDLVTDGVRMVTVRTGHPWLTRLTGAGCMATSVVGAALGAWHDRRRIDSILEAAVAGLAIFGAAAAWAAEACGAAGGGWEAGEGDGDGSGQGAPGDGEGGAPAEEPGAVAAGGLRPGPGLFRARLLDALFHLDEEQLAARVRFHEEPAPGGPGRPEGRPGPGEGVAEGEGGAR